MFATNFAVIDTRVARGRRSWRPVAEVRHHRRDPLRRGPAAGVGHHQQFHQILSRRIRRLHDEHIASAHVLHQLDIHLTVAEPAHMRPPQRHAQMPRDLLREGGIRLAGKHGNRQ